MHSFADLAIFDSQPARVGVLLSDIDTGRGRQELFADQVPELLSALATQTRVASIRASNAIEGIDVDEDRAQALDKADARFRNRNEQEFAGYRDAIDGLMSRPTAEPISVPLILSLHRQIYLYSGGRGGNLKSDDNLIVRYGDDARRIVVFEPPPWQQTEGLLTELVDRYNNAQAERAAHPIVLLAAFVVDFLAIHPVADGNGRVARLLTTSELLRLGYDVARYVSVEQRIYESKNTYYAALRQSQEQWRDGKHDIWPWTTYLVQVLAESYKGFEDRVAAGRKNSTMNKQERVRHHVLQVGPAEFRLRDLRRALPGISDPTFRLALGELRDQGLVVVEGVGPGAVWKRLHD
ncbi:MAG TPA: Fic family protein [Baekduia sp.]